MTTDTSAFLGLNYEQYSNVVKSLRLELTYILSKSMWIRDDQLKNVFENLLFVMANGFVKCLTFETGEIGMLQIMEHLLKSHFKNSGKILDTEADISYNNKKFKMSEIYAIHEKTRDSYKVQEVPVERRGEWANMSLLSALLETIICPIPDCFEPDNWEKHLLAFGVFFFENYCVMSSDLLGNEYTEEKREKRSKFLLFSIENTSPICSTTSEACRAKKLSKEFYIEMRKIMTARKKNLNDRLSSKEIKEIAERHNTNCSRVKSYCMNFIRKERMIQRNKHREDSKSPGRSPTHRVSPMFPRP